jgi:hypothetical protein
MLKHGVASRELGTDHFERHPTAKLAKRLVQPLHGLGLAVEVRPAGGSRPH